MMSLLDHTNREENECCTTRWQYMVTIVTGDGLHTMVMRMKDKLENYTLLSLPCVVLQLVFNLRYHGMQTISVSTKYVIKNLMLFSWCGSLKGGSG